MSTKKLFRGIASTAISGILIILLCLFSHCDISVLNNACLWILAWIYLSFFLYCLTFQYILFSKWVGVLSSVLGIALSVGLILLGKISYSDIQNQNYWNKKMRSSKEVIINPLKDDGFQTDKTEIWIEEIHFNGKSIDFNSITVSNGWKVESGYIYCEDVSTAEKLIIPLSENNEFDVRFATNDHSAQIEYIVDDVSVQLNLFSEFGGSVVVSPNQLWGNAPEWKKSEELAFYVVACILGWLIFGTLFAIIGKKFFTHRNMISALDQADVEK